VISLQSAHIFFVLAQKFQFGSPRSNLVLRETQGKRLGLLAAADSNEETRPRSPCIVAPRDLLTHWLADPTLP
jgi:hypothetical protein